MCVEAWNPVTSYVLANIYFPFDDANVYCSVLLFTVELFCVWLTHLQYDTDQQGWYNQANSGISKSASSEDSPNNCCKVDRSLH